MLTKSKFSVGQSVFTPKHTTAVIVHVDHGLYVVACLMESCDSHPFLKDSWCIENYTEDQLEEPIV